MNFWKEGVFIKANLWKIWIQGNPGLTPDWLLKLWHIQQLHIHEVLFYSLIDFAYNTNSIFNHRALGHYADTSDSVDLQMEI